MNAISVIRLVHMIFYECIKCLVSSANECMNADYWVQENLGHIGLNNDTD